MTVVQHIAFCQAIQSKKHLVERITADDLQDLLDIL